MTPGAGGNPGTGALKILGVIVLGLLALFCGGCSLAFVPVIFASGGGDAGFFVIWAIGLIIAGFSTWGIVRLLRSP